MKFKLWIEGKYGDLAKLQPDTVITVFHGTTLEYAYYFCVNGIDGKHLNHYRVYNHISGSKPIKFGLFVAPDVKTAFKFGNYVIKFKTLGKNLIHKFPAEAGESREYDSKYYPKSFRPEISRDMLSRGVEPQALFIGLESPRAIEKVYGWQQGVGQKSMSREEFIVFADKSNERLQYKKSDFEPQEYKMSLKDFVDRIVKREGGTEQEVLDILKRVYSRYGYLTGIGQIPYSLLKRIEQQVKRIV